MAAGKREERKELSTASCPVCLFLPAGEQSREWSDLGPTSLPAGRKTSRLSGCRASGVVKEAGAERQRKETGG